MLNAKPDTRIEKIFARLGRVQAGEQEALDELRDNAPDDIAYLLAKIERFNDLAERVRILQGAADPVTQELAALTQDYHTGWLQGVTTALEGLAFALTTIQGAADETAQEGS